MARVLLVEDNEVNLDLMRYLLLACGHELLEARDGLEALDRLRDGRPDVVLCDIELPRLDGVGFARAARADPAFAHVPLLAVTSNAMAGDRARFLEAGFDDYTAKPIDPQTFVVWLSAHLGEGPPSVPNAGQRQAAPQAVAAGPRVLVVDDVPANLSLKRSCLEPLGYRVITVDRADDALRLALAEPPDLIISDVGMPAGDGFEFIERVKLQPTLRNVPFIFISATHCGEYERAKALALGARCYLHRPLPIEELLGEIREALAMSLR